MDAVESFATQLAEELNLSIDVDVPALLDIARDAAHGVARPAAPIATFLTGAALANGADLTEVAQIVQRVSESSSTTD